MSTPPYAELVIAIRREGEGIHTVASLGCDADVPTCEDWELADLVTHIAGVYLWVTDVVTSRATERPDKAEVPDGDPVEVFEAALDGLVTALKEVDADTPVWNWTDTQPHDATFWARRMAHESSVHRFDAQSAHGVVQPIDAELALDGLDELIDVLAPRVYSRDEVEGPTGSVTMDSSDNGSWHLQVEPGGVTRVDPHNAPDVTVRGTTSALLLASYGRVPWTSLDTDGDTELLTAWTEAMQF